MLTKTTWLVSTTLALLLSVGGATPLLAQAIAERRTVVMGTELVGRVTAADAEIGRAWLDAAFRAVHRVDDLLSTWRLDAALARANRAPVGEWVQLDPALAAWLGEARAWTTATGGAFDPAIGALVGAWDLRGSGRVPAPDELRAALGASGLDCMSFSERGDRLLRGDASAWLDSGGFGKGAGLRDAEAALRSAGVTSAFLNFGGQIAVVGPDAQGEPWRVTVAHPVHRERAAAVLRMLDRSAATTAQSERFLLVAGDTLGHVLDPRTGRPVPAWGSVTVVHTDPFVADVLSTALFVMGPEEGLAWLERRPDVAALFLIRRGATLDARWNAPMDSLLIERSW